MEKSIEEMVFELEDNHNKLISIQKDLGELNIREVKYLARSYFYEIMKLLEEAEKDGFHPYKYLTDIMNTTENALEALK